jgi:hypothetical protein
MRHRQPRSLYASSLSLYSLCMLLCACSAAETHTDASEARTDASEPRTDTSEPRTDSWEDDPSCHYDCFLHGIWCRDGVSSGYQATAVPCHYWTGSCPHLSYTCLRGCALPEDVSQIDAYYLPEMGCAEKHYKVAGDACTSHQPCVPTPSELLTPADAEAPVVAYLTCDQESDTCVDVPPPVIPQYLESCGLSAGSFPVGRAGLIESDVCEGGFCWVNSTEECFHQGCTAPCTSDQGCPQGSLCVPKTLNEGQDATEPVPMFCKPGLREVYGQGLTCW